MTNDDAPDHGRRRIVADGHAPRRQGVDGGRPGDGSAIGPGPGSAALAGGLGREDAPAGEGKAPSGRHVSGGGPPPPSGGRALGAKRRNHPPAVPTAVGGGGPTALTEGVTGPSDASYVIAPDPDRADLTRIVQGTDQTGARGPVRVVEERALTIYLNGAEIVTAMTIGDWPEYLALGFLHNQGMLGPGETVTGVDHDADLGVVIVRTDGTTTYEEKLSRKTRTSGCAVGTVFGDMMEGLEGLTLPPAEVRTSWLYALAATINTTPSLYLEAGAIHGTVLCRRDRPLVYMEDVGRHNAVDKIAGWMLSEDVPAGDKILYTTGRLTSEMVIKTALMGIPVLVSRSGFTAWGVEIAERVGLTLIGRMRGRRFTCLAGEDRLVRDADPAGGDEDRRHRRKGAEG